MNPLETDEEFSISLRNPNPSFRALKSGDVYRVDFELSKEEWEYFTDPNIDRAGMVLEMTGMVAHRATKPSVGDISDVLATTLPGIPESAPVKGGKWSMWSIQAGIMCCNQVFHGFLKAAFSTYWLYYEYDGDKTSVAIAENAMREILNIKSRKELDTNAEARKRFIDLMGEFNRWTEAEKKARYGFN